MSDIDKEVINKAVAVLWWINANRIWGISAKSGDWPLALVALALSVSCVFLGAYFWMHP